MSVTMAVYILNSIKLLNFKTLAYELDGVRLENNRGKNYEKINFNEY